MRQLYVEYDQRRDEHEVNGIMVPHIKGLSWVAPDECELLDNGCIGEMSTIHQSEESTFVSIPIPKESEYLFVIVVEESGQGGSYHEIDFLYIETDFEDALDHAIDYFENEHNRSEECELCQEDPESCQKKMIDDLKKKGFADIETSSYEGAHVSIYKIKLNK
jgi:hypothetical protein